MSCLTRDARGSIVCAILLLLMGLGNAAVTCGAPPAGAADKDTRVVASAKSGDTATVRRLIALQANVNAPDVDGTTALQWAAQLNDPAMAGLLIQAGANVKAANRYGVTALSLACANGNAEIVE